MKKNLLKFKLITEEQWKEYQKIKEEHKNCTRKHWQTKCAEHCANEKLLQRQVEIMEKYFELIIDIGYDYDGYNKAENLKKVIDNLVHYASLGRVCNDNEVIYVNRDEKFNILMEKIDK